MKEGRLLYQLWHPEFLVFNELRELAARAAAAADCLIISLQERKELPGMLKLWMQRSIDLRQARPGVLVADVDASPESPEGAQGLLWPLKAAAERGHLDFVVAWAKSGRAGQRAPSSHPEVDAGNKSWRVVNPGAARVSGLKATCGHRYFATT